MTSCFNVEGYYDAYNFDADTLKNTASFVKSRKYATTQAGDKVRWNFSFSPNFGFLGSPDELIQNCELKLTFIRAHPYTAVLRLDGDTELKKPFELKDVVAITEYVSSEQLREKFSIIDYRPSTYNYYDCDVLGKDNK